jgi:hypothetical protein
MGKPTLIGEDLSNVTMLYLYSTSVYTHAKLLCLFYKKNMIVHIAKKQISIISHILALGWLQ